MWKRLVLAAILMALPLSAHALPQTGDWEAEISGTYGRAIDADENLWGGDLSVCYYIMDFIQVGLEQGIQVGEKTRGDRAWNLRSDAFFTVSLFSDSVLQPYFGGQIGIVYNDEDVQGLIGPQAGIKYYFFENVFFNTNYAYDYYFDDFEVSRGNESDGTHRVSLGIGFNF